MQATPPRCFIGKELPVNATLIQVVPRHRHCAAIRLQEEPRKMLPTGNAGLLQALFFDTL
jgi:hypothetical protein